MISRREFRGAFSPAMYSCEVVPDFQHQSSLPSQNSKFIFYAVTLLFYELCRFRQITLACMIAEAGHQASIACVSIYISKFGY